MPSSQQIRDAFLDYFKDRDHLVVPSSSLIPSNDASLLFTNAGMIQFKDIFLGEAPPPHPRAASVQCCMRAGGKHNDLENVGVTKRHHTFFEMLGNFSFGDYFKQKAINYAWQCLTEQFDIPEEKLFITVYQDDDESFAIWEQEIGIPTSRIRRCDERDNFWSMGDTGPCGPCSEIYYDNGDNFPGDFHQDHGERFVEIWNLVFTQYDRKIDGSLVPLPKPSVDTGMGLERLATVLQGVTDNYATDIFKTLFDAIAEKSNVIPDIQSLSQRVIVDHIRAIGFLLSSNMVPSNEGRGYVLRRIIRRAALHGNKMGVCAPFLHSLIPTLVTTMQDAYPQLAEQQGEIERLLEEEEQRFADTLNKGMRYIESTVQNTTGDTIAGDDVFKLYDTYGFPVDLLKDIASTKSLNLDMSGFERAMSEQRTRARTASKFQQTALSQTLHMADLPKTQFQGYDTLHGESKIVALFCKTTPKDTNHETIKTLKEKDEGYVVLETTCFYAESGGQVGDKGIIATKNGIFFVQDTQKKDGCILHFGKVMQGAIQCGVISKISVDQKRRQTICCHHSATHLLNKALREILGSHIQQKGSLVEHDRLRFDFSHPVPLQQTEITSIENRVNEIILQNGSTIQESLPMEEARAKNAVFLPEEKYQTIVRVVTIGNGFSTELCGGCHVNRTGEIGFFLITSESGIAAGVRRIEAETGITALHRMQTMRQIQTDVMRIANLEKPEQIYSHTEKQIQIQKNLELKIRKQEMQEVAMCAEHLKQNLESHHGLDVIIASIDTEKHLMRSIVEQIQKITRNTIVFLIKEETRGSMIVIGTTTDCAKDVDASRLVRKITECYGGKGGGKHNIAQAGGVIIPSWNTFKTEVINMLSSSST